MNRFLAAIFLILVIVIPASAQMSYVNLSTPSTNTATAYGYITIPGVLTNDYFTSTNGTNIIIGDPLATAFYKLNLDIYNLYEFQLTNGGAATNIYDVAGTNTTVTRTVTGGIITNTISAVVGRPEVTNSVRNIPGIPSTNVTGPNVTSGDASVTVTVTTNSGVIKFDLSVSALGPTNGITAAQATNICNYLISVANYWIGNYNGFGTNATFRSDGTNPPVKIFGGNFKLITGTDTNYVSDEDWMTNNVSPYPSNTLAYARGIGIGRGISTNGAATNAAFHSKVDSFAGNNSANIAPSNLLTPSLDNLRLFVHNFWNMDLHNWLTNFPGNNETNALPEASFTVDVTNIIGIGPCVQFNFVGYPGDPYPLPSVVRADYVIQNSGQTNTITPSTVIDPLVTNYFSGCHSISQTNVTTSQLAIAQIKDGTGGNLFLYHNPSVWIPIYLGSLTNQYAGPYTYQMFVQGQPPLNVPVIIPPGYSGNSIVWFVVYQSVSQTNYVYGDVSENIVGAVNQLVLNLKAANLWTNVFDAIYPFAGLTPTCDSKNLLGTNYPITWSGFLTNNLAHGSFGISNNSLNDVGSFPTYRPSDNGYTNGVYLAAMPLVNDDAVPMFLADTLSSIQQQDSIIFVGVSSYVAMALHAQAAILPAISPFTNAPDMFFSMDRYQQTNVWYQIASATVNISTNSVGIPPQIPDVFGMGIMDNAESGDNSTNVMGFFAIGHDIPTNQIPVLQGIIQQFESAMGR